MNVNRMKTENIVNQCGEMFESRISATVTENYQSERNLTQKLSRGLTAGTDIRTKCVEQVLRTGKQKDRAIVHSFNALLG